MFQWLLRALVVGVIRRLVVITITPLVLLIATPFIFLRACILSARNKQRFKFTVLDGYGSVWDALVAAFLWPFFRDMDRLESARRQSSNKALQPSIRKKEGER
jgi:succinate-acetate transporter protein